MDMELYLIYTWHANPANHSPLLTQEELWQLADYEAQHEGEMWAENAWLRAAEAPSYEDMAFEDWERRRGCY